MPENQLITLDQLSAAIVEMLPAFWRERPRTPAHIHVKGPEGVGASYIAAAISAGLLNLPQIPLAQFESSENFIHKDRTAIVFIDEGNDLAEESKAAGQSGNAPADAVATLPNLPENVRLVVVTKVNSIRYAFTSRENKRAIPGNMELRLNVPAGAIIERIGSLDDVELLNAVKLATHGILVKAADRGITGWDKMAGAFVGSLQEVCSKLSPDQQSAILGLRRANIFIGSQEKNTARLPPRSDEAFRKALTSRGFDNIY